MKNTSLLRTGKRKGIVLLLIFTVLAFLSATSSASAQQSVTFRVIDKKNEPLPYVTIIVIPVGDSSSKMQKVSDSSGVASFVLTTGALYRVRKSAVDYH